jgi:hypothetical protein
MRIFWQSGSVLLLGIIAAQAQSPVLKTYHDAKYGVTFRYPAEWKSGIGFYLPSPILFEPEIGQGPARAMFGFNALDEGGPYSGTDLNGVEFVYNVIPRSTATQCRKRVEGNLNSSQRRVETTLRGVTYDHFSYDGAGLGHQVTGDIYATASHGHCYLFEEAIHTISIDNAKFLSAAQSKQLRDQLDRVMQSVRIENAHRK